MYASLKTLFTVLTSPSSVKDTRLSLSPKDRQELQQSKLSQQVCKNDRVNQDTSHQILLSKNSKRKAHTPTHHSDRPGEANEVLVLFVTQISAL